jgi:prepilin-type N-terminal cleavage/methylation domain-containing protein
MKRKKDNPPMATFIYPHCLAERGQRAFTLIELLAVIAISAILASLLLVGISTVRGKADNVQCAANMRQVGAAIHLYANDHSNALPGPLYVNQKWTYYSGDPTQLLYHIATYLGLPAPYRLREKADVMRCPAWMHVVEDPDDVNGKSYAVSLYDLEGNRFAPFGYPGQVDPKRFDEIEDPARTPILQDVNLGSASYPVSAHGDEFHVLFFSGHVETLESSALSNP